MRLLGGWHEDPLWAGVYGWLVEHRRVGGLAWRVGLGTDLGLLYDAVREVGRLPAGSRVLDVPTGNGVAMRGLAPGQGSTTSPPTSRDGCSSARSPPPAGSASPSR
jgi:hypothetical protein